MADSLPMAFSWKLKIMQMAHSFNNNNQSDSLSCCLGQIWFWLDIPACCKTLSS